MTDEGPAPESVEEPAAAEGPDEPAAESVEEPAAESVEGSTASPAQEFDQPAPGEAVTPDRLDRALERLRSEIPEPEVQTSSEADSDDC